MSIRTLCSLGMTILPLSACAQTERKMTEAVAVPRTVDSEPGLAGERQPHAGMLRYPDVSATHIAFVYANNVWLAPREGGMAHPLAGAPEQEMFPRFSPDGQTVAFGANYDGNRDLYSMPVGGGVPKRITHHPADEILCDWTSDGRLLFYTNGLAGLSRQTQLFTVSAEGGMPTRLPVPYGANGAISPDGQWLAYTPHSRDHRTWKRYRGGMATDIWLFNLRDHSSKQMTDWEGTDTQPMWHGNTVYYLSDAGEGHRLNIWSYDTATGNRRQITNVRDFDIKWPAMGPGADGNGEIIFQRGPDLNVLNLSNGEIRTVMVTIPGDRPRIRPQRVDTSEFITGWDISSTGKRAVFEARGDIWTVPAKKGSARNLTRTSGIAERYPAWSPDGQWVAFFSDATGEYELNLRQSDGQGESRSLTRDGGSHRYAPTWSPDSKLIAFTDKAGGIHVHDVDAGATREIDREPWASTPRLNWSSDSNWLTYTKGGENRVSSIWIYHHGDNQTHQVTAGMFNDSWPTFDRKGDYLFFASQRRFESPTYEDVGTTFVYADTDQLIIVPLRADVEHPWAPKSDEEKWGDDEEEDEEEDEEDKEGKEDKNGADSGEDDAQEKNDDDGEDDSADKDDEDKKGEDEIKPVKIELEGFEQRAILLPVDHGTFSNLAVNHEGKLVYVRGAPRGSGRDSSIKIFDLTDDKKEEHTVFEKVGSFAMSANGKKILVRKDGKYAVVDAAKDQKLEDTLSLSGLSAVIDPREEWRQMFSEAWRVMRDYFYDPNMHGVDWDAVRLQYAPMLDDCTSREDLSYILGEMFAELNVGHAYVRGGGDTEVGPRVAVGMLGADFELQEGVYRITRIYQGAPWDVDARGPLSQPGINVKSGDYLLAVNGLPIDTSRDVWAAFVGLAGETVTLTVSSVPIKDEAARDVVVKLLPNEEDLRFRAWIEEKRAHVDRESDGRIGYIYVPNTGVQGQNELFRQFYGQVQKQALIIDERWNGGGQIPTRFIELLNRPATNFWARRDGHDWPWPPDAHQGPKCMLINGLAGSGGDCFPYYFRQSGLGKLIGMRTWGGLVGISGNPLLIDGERITAPTFAFYETDGTWGIEGHGVDPDIEVVDDPALMIDGGDPQLDEAIKHLQKELAANPYTPPRRPAYPDRRGMGIRDADK